MSCLSKILFATTASLVVLSGTAFADDEGAAAAEPGTAPVTATDANGDGMVDTGSVGRPLNLKKGEIGIHVDALINLSKDNVFKPFAIAPDIFYGVSDKLTVGLVHGRGLCLTGEDNGCPKPYNDIGFEVLASLKHDAHMDLAARIGFDVLAFSPDFAGSVRVGLSFQYLTGKVAIIAHPSIGIGVSQRDAGNKESLSIPVKIAFQASPKLAPYLHTGLGGAFYPGQFGVNPIIGGASLDGDGPGFGDTYVIPLGVGALYSVNEKVDVGAEFLFPGLLGSDFATADNRQLIIFGNFRL